jgi:nucleoid-associated protein YgaU
VDWPSAPASDLVPDWPGSSADRPQPAPGEHVVLRGQCLWDIAADWLQQQTPGAPVPAAAVARATRDWWQANAAVIGPDPDLLVPGQVLRPPG